MQAQAQTDSEHTQKNTCAHAKTFLHVRMEATCIRKIHAHGQVIDEHVYVKYMHTEVNDEQMMN